MKRTLLIAILPLLLLSNQGISQIITPVIKANFGVEADLKANFFGGMPLPANDDWFPGSNGTGIYIIDTTGAAAIMQGYIADSSARNACFTRHMNYPVYSIVNGRLLYDALYVRDHHNYDSTAFISGNKNGQSAGLWNGGATPVPNKSDLNDILVHIRRDGPALSDSLWFFAGLSLHGNTGNRYYDFELYQTDIYFNSADNKFYNYGPDAGHTSWKFDNLGNVISPGDVILTAEFSSSSLTLLEARIWIDKSSLSITPIPFSWGGLFDGDGAGAQFGYASIVPKTGGTFYSGMQCADSTWAGPFGFADVTNIAKVTYDSRSFMEVSVNMTKIGLDPYTLLGTSGCNLSFRRFMAKTRSSTSFTSELKDFAGPYLIARPAPAVVIGDSSLFCGEEPDTSTLSVQNPIATSEYIWTTIGGHIITSPATGPSIQVDMPGTYIVTQTLFGGCTPYSTDTIMLERDSMGCKPLAVENLSFTGNYNYPDILLQWTTPDKDIVSFDIERSTDGRHFSKIGSLVPIANSDAAQYYRATDPAGNLNYSTFYYRLKVIKQSSAHDYSRVIVVRKDYESKEEFRLLPNPAKNYVQIYSRQNNASPLQVEIYNASGHKVFVSKLSSANEKMNLERLPPGLYIVQIFTNDHYTMQQKKLLISR